jgi:hypothetical protein
MADAVTRLRAGDASNATRDVGLVAGGVPNAVEVKTEPFDDSLLDVGDLVRMFEESEESTYTARKLAERDRDYYDHKQLTAEEQSTLRKRGQPEVVANRIQPKVNFLVGLEKSQRIDPRAFPRTPQHEQDADGASQALKYVADSEDYDDKRSHVWKNLLIEGAGGIAVAVEPSPYADEMCIRLRRAAWDRMFWDPHSSEHDFSDAGYLGMVVWQDFDEALKQYPDGREALEHTLSSAPSETYDDKPKWNHWADKKRKRVRICQIWLKRGDDWHFAEYTKGGILKAGPSPYVTDQGESEPELFFQSAYVDRDNNRYGLVRIMISLQDEINKRRSKALHLLNTNQTTYEEGAIDDIEEYRRQAARPDGTMKVAPGALEGQGRVRTDTRVDLATGQVQLLQESKNELDQIGPNATMMGEKAGGSSSASGKAIIASQQGGMMEVGDLLDNLRHLDKRVFRAIWNRIRQYWTGEKWIRVTDDDRNVKWVAMNVDPQMMQMAMQQNPEMAERIAGVVGNVAELDCDIIIDEAPDSVTPALEQWQGLVELAKAGVPIPPDVLIESAPNLKNKDRLLERMQKPNPMAEQQQQVQMAGLVASIKKLESEVALNMARAGKEQMPESGAQPQPQDFEVPPEIQVARELAEIDNTRAQTEYTQTKTTLEPVKMRQQAQAAQQRAQQFQRRPEMAR